MTNNKYIVIINGEQIKKCYGTFTCSRDAAEWIAKKKLATPGNYQIWSLHNKELCK